MDNYILEIKNLKHYYTDSNNKTLDSINLKIKKMNLLPYLAHQDAEKQR
nr:hypothetical protein [Borrelia duttonii]